MPVELSFECVPEDLCPRLEKKKGAKFVFLGRHPISRAMMVLSSTDEEDAKDSFLVPLMPLCSETMAGIAGVLQFAEGQNPYNKGVVFSHGSQWVGAVAVEG